jgi:regulator of protease activity HflC (stomatin/prohibitin superfamily)
MILVVIGYSIGSTKIITQGNQALVERLGKFHKKLEPGLNYIIPFIDRVAVEDTIREQVLDIPAQQAHHQGQHFCRSRRGCLLESRRFDESLLQR